MERKPTGTIEFDGLSGKRQSRPTNFIIDIRDYKGRPGYTGKE
jgi:hypothetical protein